MRAICLSCGHKIEMDRAYDDYEGEIKCVVCGSILTVRTEEGKFKSVSLVKAEPYHSASNDGAPGELPSSQMA